MKFTLAVAAAIIAFVQAQSISDLPSCSLSCIVTAVEGTGCGVTDYACACGKAAQLTASVTPCVESACDAADQAKVVSVLEGICSSVGVPITISTPATSSSAPASSSTPASTPASSSASASATASSSAAGGYGSSSSSAAASSSSAAATGVCTTSTSTSTVYVGPTSSAAAGSNGTYTSATPSAYTGAASANGVTFGAAGIIAALAYAL